MLLGTPGASVTRTRLYQMPFGGPGGQLGSLELLTQSEIVPTLFDVGRRNITVDVAGSSPTLDYVVMNPPFTRSVGGSQLLGSLGGNAFSEARRRLSELARSPDVSANLNAGLGAPFIDLAARAVRPGGRIAFVLPKTLLTGESWEPTRKLLGSEFHVEFVMTAHEPGHWNFSDSTELSEVLVVARRWGEDEDRSDAMTTWIALSDNPDTAVEALGVASAVRRAAPAALRPPKPSAKVLRDARRAIRDGGDPLGTVLCTLRSPDERRADGATYTPAAIVDAMVDWAATETKPGRVVDPGTGSGRFAVAAGRRFPRAEILAVELDPVASILARGHLAAAGLSGRARVVGNDYRTFAAGRFEDTTLYLGKWGMPLAPVG